MIELFHFHGNSETTRKQQSEEQHGEGKILTHSYMNEQEQEETK